MANYRAVRRSYGFRGRVWETGDIAENVSNDENINEHFEQVKTGDSEDKPRDEAFDPPEPETFSDWQKHDTEIDPAPGLEERKTHKPKAKRK